MSFMVVQGVKIHYRLEGNKRGKVLILLHGWSGSIKWWNRVVPRLSKDYLMLLIDLPGHGLSSKLPVQLYENSIEVMSSILHSIINRLGIDKPILVGWSLGGMVSLQYALDHPRKLSALILVDTSAVGKTVPSLGYLPKIPYYCIPDIRKILPLVKMQLRMTGKALNFINGTPLKNAVGKVLVDSIATGKKPDKRIVLWATGILLEDLNISGLLQTAVGILLFDVVDRLHELNVPTLIIYGQEDKNFYFGLQELLHGGIRGSRLTVIDGVGHCPHVEKPEEFNKAVIEFLNETENRAYGSRLVS
jgi:pimeloyl-ACP methyl ester carboxylesterase